jgi:hypothetical protein
MLEKIMSKYKRVPVTAAKNIADTYDKEEIIILAIDRKHDKVHITTYGKTKAACKTAEMTGDFLSEIFQLQDDNAPKYFNELVEEIKTAWLKKKREKEKTQ